MALIEQQQCEHGQRRQLAAVQRIQQDLRSHHHNIAHLHDVAQRYVGHLVARYAPTSVAALQVLYEQLELLIHERLGRNEERHLGVILQCRGVQTVLRV